ncbi:MAG: J domain-containing protein [Chloroflexota bacterium]
MEPDHYRILQVDPRAEIEVIEAAYRRLAAKYHPDRNHSPDATDRMKLINAAYEVLSDPQKRMAYDSRRGLSSGDGLSFGRNGAGMSYIWKNLWLVMAVILLVALTVLVRFNPRFLLTVGMLLLVLWGYHILRTSLKG